MAPQLHAHANALLATWLEPNDGHHRLRFARWEADGWSPPVTIADDAKIVANWADTPTILASTDGALVVSWAEKKKGPEAHAYDAVVARSTDGGVTWRRLGTLHRDGTPTEHGFVSLASDGAGVRAIWLDGRATATPDGATALRTATIGEAIGEESVIDDRVCDCCGTAVANAATGPVVVYRDRSTDEVRDIGVAIRARDGWGTKALHDDGWKIAGCPVNGPAVVGRGTDVAIAWYTGASTPRVLAAFSRDGGVTFGAPIEVDAPRDDRSPIGRVGIVMTSGGALVTWMSARGEAAEILMRQIAFDGTVRVEQVVAKTGSGRSAGFPRVASIGSKVFVAWTESTKPSKLHITMR